MTAKYPSTFLASSPTKMAFIIDCDTGLNSSALSSTFLEQFPENSDIFLFYHNDDRGMNRRLKRLETNNHGVFFFPTSFQGIATNIAFLLGQIHSKYDDFVLVAEYQPGYEDLCQQLIANNPKLENRVQLRSFQRISEFEQFLQELCQLQSDQIPSFILNYSKKSLFHRCPLETRQQSSIVFRFGEMLHHLDTEHPDIKYEYCDQCQRYISERNYGQSQELQNHIADEHWQNDTGFILIIHT